MSICYVPSPVLGLASWNPCADPREQQQVFPGSLPTVWIGGLLPLPQRHLQGEESFEWVQKGGWLGRPGGIRLQRPVPRAHLPPGVPTGFFTSVGKCSGRPSVNSVQLHLVKPVKRCGPGKGRPQGSQKESCPEAQEAEAFTKVCLGLGGEGSQYPVGPE